MSHANITGAKIWAIKRDDWEIKGIKCDYIYPDITTINRYPKARDFEPGEFEKLYTQYPTLEVVFEKGIEPIHPIAYELFVKQINEQHPDLKLELVSIDKKGILPKMEFRVKNIENLELAKRELKEKKSEILKLQTERNYAEKLLINDPRSKLRGIKEKKEFQSARSKLRGIHHPTVNKFCFVNSTKVITGDHSQVVISKNIYNFTELKQEIDKTETILTDESKSETKSLLSQLANETKNETCKILAKQIMSKTGKAITQLPKLYEYLATFI